MAGCNDEFASYAHGTKGSAVISTSGHTPAKCRIYKGQNMTNARRPGLGRRNREPNPYQLEWDDLIDAIRNDKPYNEVQRGAEASLVTAMGRMAAHTGQVITWDEMLNCEHEFAPDVDKLIIDGPAPPPAPLHGSVPPPHPQPGRSGMGGRGGMWGGPLFITRRGGLPSAFRIQTHVGRGPQSSQGETKVSHERRGRLLVCL